MLRYAVSVIDVIDVGLNLTIDPKKEQFVGSKAEVANKFLNREYRKGYEVPEIVS